MKISKPWNLTYVEGSMVMPRFDRQKIAQLHLEQFGAEEEALEQAYKVIDAGFNTIIIECKEKNVLLNEMEIRRLRKK